MAFEDLSVTRAHGLAFKVATMWATLSVPNNAGMTMDDIDPLAGQVGKSREVCRCREPLRLEAPIWLGEAARS